MSEYLATINWQRDDEEFLAGKYSRAHEWQFDGGLTVPASPSPHIVPAPWSDVANVDPEEAFVASLASCHMLFFLSFAAEQGLLVDSYIDEAIGVLARNDAGRLAMTRVTLRPKIEFGNTNPPTEDAINAIHQHAHKDCFIANSVTTEVVIATR